MSRKPQVVTASDEVKDQLQSIVNRRKSEQRLVERAKIILKCFEGMPLEDIAEQVGVSKVTVSKWKRRFLSDGLQGLFDMPRSGRTASYTKQDEQRVIDQISREPPDGLARWDGATLARELDYSDDFVWRVMRKNNLRLNRSRSWCVSTDPEFSTKAADIVGLYLAPPEDAIVISIDEKPSMQALSRTVGYVKTQDGATMRAYKSTYRRNGTLNLFGALEIATGQIHGKCTKYKKRSDFLQFMDELLEELPNNDEGSTTYHVILDNYCIHKRCEEWLTTHPNVKFHYTPTSASWLNMVEIWFGILSRKVLKDASFDSVEELKSAINAYMKAYNEHGAHPFQWRKREVKGSQIRNTITNLCN